LYILGDKNYGVAQELGCSDEALKRLRPFAKPDA
tara:strand:+ start:82 stop:183 length:102 start_codon:yes stop_codon:yes gene_type:complete